MTLRSGRGGCLMRYKAMFVAGLAVGFVVGARAGRERYDQLVKAGRQVAEHPAVQKAAQTATAKATDLTKTATQHAASYVPFARFGGKSGADVPAEEAGDSGEAHLAHQTDGSTTSYNGIRTTAD